MNSGFWLGTPILNKAPQRIISLVPSQSELLFDLGLDNRVVGITKFCVHPQKWLKEKAIIGGTKNAHFEEIKALQPDLIIANKEENIKEDLEELSKIAPIWVTDIQNLEEAWVMINEIGTLTQTEEKAKEIIEKTKEGFQNLSSNKKNKKVAYFIWRKPWMAAASATFIDDLLSRLGFTNVFENKTRYPEFSLEELKILKPDYLFLSSEPFPFNEKHAIEIRTQLPNCKIKFVDGEFFSWYGSRLLLAIEYFKSFMEDDTTIFKG